MSTLASTRASAYAGIGFVILMLANVFGSPSAGELGDSGGRVITRVVSHATAIQAWNWVLSIAVVAMLVFAAGLTARVVDDTVTRHVAFAGAIVLTTTAIVQHAVTAVLTFVVNGASPATASLLNQANYVIEDFVRLGIVVFVGALSIRGELPRWIRGLGVGCALLNLAAAGSLAHAGALAPDGPVSAVALVTFVVWTASASASLLRTGRSDVTLQPTGTGRSTRSLAD